mmetsp:Transcript_13183/g.14979  ORF Transcript_13183/g.14979 Transcript_13183/m.14979 type:complete len:89 (-) Transcript_13183:1749-2015(-)
MIISSVFVLPFVAVAIVVIVIVVDNDLRIIVAIIISVVPVPVYCYCYYYIQHDLIINRNRYIFHNDQQRYQLELYLLLSVWENNWIVT